MSHVSNRGTNEEVLLQKWVVLRGMEISNKKEENLIHKNITDGLPGKDKPANHNSQSLKKVIIETCLEIAPEWQKRDALSLRRN